MSDPIKLQITAIGLAKALDDQLNGLVVKLDKVKFSTDTFVSVPNDPHTDLANIVHEAPLVAGGTSASQNTLRFSVMVNASVEHTIGSIGLYTDDDVLFAVASVNTGYLMKLLPRVSFVMAFGMSLSTYLLENISVVIDSESALAVAMMFQHENHENPHPQYAFDADTLALAEAIETKFGLYATIALLNLTVDNSVDFLTSLLSAHKNAGNPHPQYLLASTFGVDLPMTASIDTPLVDTNRALGWNGEDGDVFFQKSNVTWWSNYQQTITFKPWRSYGTFLLWLNLDHQGNGTARIKIFNEAGVVLSDDLIFQESKASYGYHAEPIKYVFNIPKGGYAEIFYRVEVWNKHKGQVKGTVYVDDRPKSFMPVGYQSSVDVQNEYEDGGEVEETAINYADYPVTEWSRFSSTLNDYVSLSDTTTFSTPADKIPHFHRDLFAANVNAELWIVLEVGTQLVQSPSDYAAVEAQVIRGSTDVDGNIVITIPLSMRTVDTPNNETLVYQVAYYVTEVTKGADDPFPAGSMDGVHEFFTNP